MVLCLSTNKECVAAWEGGFLSSSKNLLRLGVKSCDLYPYHWHDGSTQAIRSYLPYKLPGFIMSKMLGGLWRKTLDTCLQVFKINIALFWSLNERFGNIFSPWIYLLQICIYHVYYLYIFSTIWVQIGEDILKVPHKLQNNIIPLLFWCLSLLSRASFSLAVWFIWVSR